MTAPALRQIRSLVAVGRFFYLVRDGMFPLIFLLVLLLVRPTYFLGHPGWDRAAMVAGAVIALLGQAFRLFVIGYAYIVRGGKNRQVHARHLVVAGLYAHCRNPMYVGNFLIACGVCLLYGSAWTYGVVIPFFAFVYLTITANEENYLHGRFGAEYEEYLQRVNRFVPNFRGLGASLSGFNFRWRDSLRKEYGTLCGTLAGLNAVLIWKLYYLHGWAAEHTVITGLLLLFVPIAILYVTLRVLKLSGRLREPTPAAAPGSPPLPSSPGQQ